MKRRYLFLCVMLVFVLLANSIDANAMNTGFSTEDMSEEDRNSFISHVDFSLLTTEPTRINLDCFVVTEQGKIAAVQTGYGRKTVCVYAADGSFLYGYSFICEQSLAVEWDADRLNLYFVRSGIIMSVDPNGNIGEMKRVPDTTDNGIYDNLLRKSKRVVGDVTYQLKKDKWLALSFSQLVVIDAAGVETVLYKSDVAEPKSIKSIFVRVFEEGREEFLWFFVLIIALVIWRYRKSKRSKIADFRDEGENPLEGTQKPL